MDDQLPIINASFYYSRSLPLSNAVPPLFIIFQSNGSMHVRSVTKPVLKDFLRISYLTSTVEFNVKELYASRYPNESVSNDGLVTRNLVSFCQSVNSANT